MTFLVLAGIIGGGGFYQLRKAMADAEESEGGGGIPAMQAAASGKPAKDQRLDQQEEFTQTLPPDY